MATCSWSKHPTTKSLPNSSKTRTSRQGTPYTSSTPTSKTCNPSHSKNPSPAVSNWPKQASPASPAARTCTSRRAGALGASFPEGMAYYRADTTEAERANYQRWRMSGEFHLFDPLELLTLP